MYPSKSKQNEKTNNKNTTDDNKYKATIKAIINQIQFKTIKIKATTKQPRNQTSTKSIINKNHQSIPLQNYR